MHQNVYTSEVPNYPTCFVMSGGPLSKGEGKGHTRTGHDGTDGELRYNSTLSLTSALDWGVCSTSRTGRFTPGKDPLPLVW